MIYKTYTIGGELYHHGILGQKHGVRNGPPYPLSAGDHSASEKKAGWRKSLKVHDSGLVVDAMTGELKQNKAYDKAYWRRERFNRDYLLKPLVDKFDKKKEEQDHLVDTLNHFEYIKFKERVNIKSREAGRKYWDNLDKEDHNVANDRWKRMSDEIIDKCGDWYNDKGYKNAEYKEAIRSGNKKKACRVALKQLGIPITAGNIEMIEPVIFWD